MSDAFITHGVSKQIASDYLNTSEGQIYLRHAMQADQALLKKEPTKIRDRVLDHLTSGRELPRMEIINEPLVKIVPHGSTPSGHSPFWTKEAELDTASKAGKNLGQYFGLPGVSQSDKYDVYRVTPKAPTEVFVNTVAPTSELVNGTKISTTGGATQYLTPNRKLYDEAKFVKSIDNLHIPLQKAQNPHDINTAAHAKAVHINTVVKGAGILGTAYGVYSGISDVKTAVNAAQTSEEKWRVGGKQGADVATRGLVTGFAAAVCAVPGAIGGTVAGAAAGTLVAPGPGTVGGGIAGGVVGGVAAGSACAVVAEKLYEGSAVQKGAQYVGEKAVDLGQRLNNYLFSDDKAGAQNPTQLKTNALGDKLSLNNQDDYPRILSQPLPVNASLQEMNAYAFAALLSDDPKVTTKGLEQVFNSHQGIEGMRLVEQFGIAHEQQQLQLQAQNQAQEVKSPSRSMSM